VGLVKASIRNDPQSDYFRIRCPDGVVYRDSDRALDWRRLFDKRLPWPDRRGGSPLLRLPQPLICSRFFPRMAFLVSQLLVGAEHASTRHPSCPLSSHCTGQPSLRTTSEPLTADVRIDEEIGKKKRVPGDLVLRPRPLVTETAHCVTFPQGSRFQFYETFSYSLYRSCFA
jgi:hypothetical protein